MSESLKYAYSEKDAAYFRGVRRDIIEDMPRKTKAILEIGCGSGATLAFAKSQGKATKTVGVEIDPHSAAIARNCADEILDGNIENIDLPSSVGPFDVVIMSEVLEHLVDPWLVLKKLYPLVSVGGAIYASSPNIAHISTIKMLLGNRWTYSESGRFDWTHLRWFTPETYQELIESAGFTVIWNRPIVPMTIKQKLANAVTLNAFRHLFVSQIFIKAIRPA